MAGQGQSANTSICMGLGAGIMQWGGGSTLPNLNTGGAFVLRNESIGEVFAVPPSGPVRSAQGMTLSGGSFTGNLVGNVTGQVTGAVVATTISASGLVTSSVAAGSPILSFAFTNATPTVAWTDSGAANHAPTTAPAGYLQVRAGGLTYYVPAWA